MPTDMREHIRNMQEEAGAKEEAHQAIIGKTQNEIVARMKKEDEVISNTLNLFLPSILVINAEHIS